MNDDLRIDLALVSGQLSEITKGLVALSTCVADLADAFYEFLDGFNSEGEDGETGTS